MTNQTVIAEVVLRGSDGSSILEEESISSKTAERYKIDENHMQLARENLLDYGFDVITTSPYSLSIQGDKRLFERVFKTRLRKRQVPISESPLREEEQGFFEAQDPIEIPEKLLPYVAAVTFPQPPELFP
ncbi:MAG: hypothetical protein GY928_38585 [Colwellia sp.]|nr:hypothetical protein [Colwellia sp.]